ncbi:MAG: glycosyltransferase family 39 protein [Elusimicrobia bacterium]|nr:glycosyltransferase family 39 protein [Elusimicrobiota bacterium]
MTMIRFNDHWITNRNQLANKLKLISGSIIVLFSIFHVLIVTSMVSENSDNSAIVFATNNDASVAITVATQTRWFNDNGWRPYGPLYYRLAHSLSGMVPYSKAQSAIPQEANQVNHHFSLMLVSLVSLLLTCFFIAGLFGLEGAEKIGVASLFLSLFLLNRTFSRYVLVAHPDFLLTFFTSLLFVSAHRFLKDPTNLALTFIGVTFGLMLSTKITAILFLPGIFWILFCSKSWRGNLKNYLNFGLGSTATYFLVGYPQNFKIQETLAFLKTQSQHSKIADATSIGEWISLFAHQFWMPLVLSLILCVFFGKRLDSVGSDEKRLDSSGKIKLFLFGLFPLLALVSQKFSTPHDYYTIPFGILLLMVCCVLSRERLSCRYLATLLVYESQKLVL